MDKKIKMKNAIKIANKIKDKRNGLNSEKVKHAKW